ncbi:hypothetical protein ACFL0V_04775 [Nanoarchaeota archaeon]
MKKITRKKKADMTIGLIIAIAIGLTILVISLYLLTGRGKQLDKVGKCEGKMCIVENEKCPGDTKRGLTPCKKGDKSGWCCSDLLSGG